MAGTQRHPPHPVTAMAGLIIRRGGAASGSPANPPAAGDKPVTASGDPDIRQDERSAHLRFVETTTSTRDERAPAPPFVPQPGQKAHTSGSNEVVRTSRAAAPSAPMPIASPTPGAPTAEVSGRAAESSTTTAAAPSRPAPSPFTDPQQVLRGFILKRTVADRPAVEEEALPRDLQLEIADDLVAMLHQLEMHPGRFAFFYAMRLLECAYPSLPRLGHAARPADEPVRLGQDAMLRFSPGDVNAYRPPTQSRPAMLRINCMGLLGPNGPMPTFQTDFIQKRRAVGDRTLAQFLDIFHHRLGMLFYRAWAQHQRTVSRDRARSDFDDRGTQRHPGSVESDEDAFGRYLASLIGLGLPSLRNRDAVQDRAKIHFAGRLMVRTANAEGLASILGRYFGVTCTIREFVGRWIDLPAEERQALGLAPHTMRLGGEGPGPRVVLGGRTWDCQQRFRVRLGPMHFDQYQRLLPDRLGMRRINDWIRTYAGLELAWDVQLVLRADQVPQMCLGRLGQLGWSSWLLSRPETRDRDDLVVESQRHAC